MYYINENTVKDTVDQSSINQVIEDVFISLTRNDAFNFPVVRDSLDYRDAIFGFKSAFDRSGPTLAIKAGGLWPSNRDLGLPNHQSTIMLFDPETGGPYALVLGTYLTALRTAAASALSIRALARDNAKALGVVGAGGQALYQVHAAMAEREFERVYIYDENEKNAQALANSLANDVEAIVEVSPALLAPQSDVIITITPSREPILNLDWINPGTHIACMGADTKGKQELSPKIIGKARVFGDEVDQATSIGECQHAFNLGLISKEDIHPLGKVLSGDLIGRASDTQLTVFDSTGMGLQDLAAAKLALDLAIESGLAQVLET